MHCNSHQTVIKIIVAEEYASPADAERRDTERRHTGTKKRRKSVQLCVYIYLSTCICMCIMRDRKYLRLEGTRYRLHAIGHLLLMTCITSSGIYKTGSYIFASCSYARSYIYTYYICL